MDNYDKYWLFIRKYLFSILLILAGFTFMIMGIGTNSTTNLSQSNTFLIGAIVLFILGFVSLYFIMTAKTSKTATVIASVVFLLASVVFIQLNIKSVKDRIIYEQEWEDSENLAKQGLSDIKKLQEAHDRKYKKLATSFEDLVKFAKFDSIRVLTKAIGDVPPKKMTVEQARALNHRYPVIWTEKDALTLGLIIREYKKLPVANDIFGKDTKENDNRDYEFDVDQLATQRTIDNKGKKFSFKTAIVDSLNTVLIQAIPPYGPQLDYDVKDTLQIGDLKEKQIKTNWK
jgi:Ca2+/Na+ antiporter|tara:strand:+ start:1620 stop:2480 length:861 start_codon:yes stop_codon:yes gene_type:complete